MRYIITMMLLIAAASSFKLHAAETDNDFIGRIEQRLPKGWQTDYDQHGILITTPPMDLVGSERSNAARISQSSLVIRLRLTPKYTTSMLKRVDKHNERAKAEFDRVGLSKHDIHEIDRRQIERPRYYDADYGIVVAYPSYCPARASDREALRRFIGRISEGWKPYDEAVSNVADDISATLLR